MKSLGRTIDRILRVDPNLEGILLRIKNKWEKRPSKTMDYWKELLDYLNSEPVKTHPRLNEIRSIVVTKKSVNHPLYTFEETNPGDKTLGLIPENVADCIRRHDLKTIRLAKLQVQANMTHNAALLAKLNREEVLMEINMRRIWLCLKDGFQLWGKPINYTIKSQKGSLILVEQQPVPQQQPGQPMILPMNPNNLRNFFRQMGIDPNSLGMPPNNPNPDDEG
jgi:hypothetical protein